MRVKLVKISSNHNELRTDLLVGNQVCDPVVGQRYVVWGEPLIEGGTVRFVSTSPVQEIEKLENELLKFKTVNSVYLIERLGEGSNG